MQAYHLYQLTIIDKLQKKSSIRFTLFLHAHLNFKCKQRVNQNLLPIDQYKQEAKKCTTKLWLAKKADSAVFGVSVARAVRALALERTIF